MQIALRELAEITRGRFHGPDVMIGGLSTDSRNIRPGDLFIALRGTHVDGHGFIPAALECGASAVLLEEAAQIAPPGVFPRVIVKDTFQALGAIGAWYRRRFLGKLLCVTGSNGKTILKDILYRIMAPVLGVSRNRGSYNSRLGVPLALLSMEMSDALWITEAGVSEPGDMKYLQEILRPDCGILTNIGMAHIGGFGTRENIAREKLRLFLEIPREGWVLLPGDEPLVENWAEELSCRVFFLNREKEQIPWFEPLVHMGSRVALTVHFPGEAMPRRIILRTPSREIARDTELAICAAWLLGALPGEIARVLEEFETSETRMEIWNSPGGVTFINDACSSDPISVESALRSMGSITGNSGRRIFVFGGMGELGDYFGEQHSQVGRLAASYGVDHLFLPMGEGLDRTAAAYATQGNGQVTRYIDGASLLTLISTEIGSGDTLLLKGPRQGTIAQTAPRLFEAIAPNRLIVDFSAVLENIRRFRGHLGDSVKILAMVKALAYGSDMTRLALALQDSGVEYLGVSTPDEGATLRRLGTSLPILVMITAPDEVAKVCAHRLTPVVSSPDVAERLVSWVKGHNSQIAVHIKVDTGMGRMGIAPSQVPRILDLLESCPGITISGIMTHLGSADDPTADAATMMQFQQFQETIALLKARGYNDLVKHACATSGAIRFPWAHFDMVRVGLGLYGLYPHTSLAAQLPLIPAISLVTRVVDVREHPRGATLGYGATYVVEREGFRVAILPLGYHDGLPWALSNRGVVMIHGKRAPMVGRVSMDSVMVDVSDIPEAVKGADALVFGAHGGYELRPEEVARDAGTIVYELLARIGPRVQRIFRH